MRKGVKNFWHNAFIIESFESQFSARVDPVLALDSCLSLSLPVAFDVVLVLLETFQEVG